MDYTSTPIFTAMKAKLAYMTARQSVLAQNIANIDTPGYRAQDIKAPNFESMVSGGKLQMTRTSPLDLGGAGGISSTFQAEPRSLNYETNPNKNTVSLEDEVEQLSLNQQDYQEVTALYTKMISLFRTAIDASGTTG